MNEGRSCQEQVTMASKEDNTTHETQDENAEKSMNSTTVEENQKDELQVERVMTRRSKGRPKQNTEANAKTQTRTLSAKIIKTDRITAGMVDSMKVTDLRKQLEQLNLSSKGKKEELQIRLKKYIEEKGKKVLLEEEEDMQNDEEGDDDDEGEREDSACSEENDSDEEGSDAESFATPYSQGVKRHKGPYYSNNHRPNRDVHYDRASGQNTFSIRDVEDSIAHFSGDDKLPVKKWISDFEDLAVLLNWNELQKFIYAKRMLVGSAKKFITYEKGIQSWDTLKHRLKREFKAKVNDTLIHEQLARRKRQSDESGRQYIYAMQEIASQGNIQEDALMQHIIDGVQDDELNKSILYSATTLSDLKEKFGIYDRMKERTNGKKMRNNSGKDFKGNKKTPKKRHCFSCGSAEHDVSKCNVKDKGPKCFKCNKYGHIAPKCTESQTGGEKITVSCVFSAEKRTIDVKMNGTKCKALVDNGSDVNLIRRDAYAQIGSPKLRQVTHRVFIGLGDAKTTPEGCFTPELVIDGELYYTEFFVVPTSAMMHKIILGHEWLKTVTVTITRGVVTIERPQMKNVSNDAASQAIEASTEQKKHREEDPTEDSSNNEFRELAMVHCIATEEIDIKEPYKSEVIELIRSYEPKGERLTTTETKIILKSNEPVRQQPRRLAPKERDILNRQISQWLNEGIIQPSNSEYASAVVIVPKKDGSYRVCVDYRRLNQKTVRDRFPMPLVEGAIDSLVNARVFSVIDLKNGFFHVPIAEDSRKYTAFVTESGQYEFLRTPFGLTNSPASFLRFVDEVFKDLIQRKVVITYVDDLIIPGVDEKDGLNKLKETIEVAAANGLLINWKKCQFLQRKVEFLGHVVENGSVSPSPTKVKSVQKFPIPKTKKHVQSFLGLTGYFRKFIKDYATIARPLSNLLKNGQSFRFATEELRAFEALKSALSHQPLLRIYNPEAITELHTDASKEGYGAVLLQKTSAEDQFQPVHYMSCKTSDAEKKCHSYELEVLAIIKALKKFRVYLLGVKFKLITDCAAFQKTLHKKDLPPKIARWALSLEEFDYEVEHRPGQRMKHVDALSRFPVMVVEDKILTMIRKQQEGEERLKVIKRILEKESYEDYLIEDGILKKQAGSKNVIVLPASMQTETIRRIHENGHFGVKKMAEQIKEEFYIPNLQEKLENYISCCVKCILAEKKKGKREGALMPIPKGDIPLCTYHIDHLGPMTVTTKLYKYIFVVVDGFTKFVWLYPTKTTNAAEVINRLTVQQKTFGNPRRIITDKGGAFVSADFREYCSNESIEHITITAGVPRGNGQVERINRIIIAVLTKLSLEDPNKWYQHVDRVQRSINSTFQRSIQMTPFEALIGSKMRQKEDVEVTRLLEQEAVQVFDEERNELRAEAKKNILKIQEENRRSHKRNSRPATKYEVGDLVAIKRTQFGPGLKIYPPYLGPYMVSRVKGADRYEVTKIGDGEGPNVTSTAVDYMKSYIGTTSGTEVLSGTAECGE